MGRLRVALVLGAAVWPGGRPSPTLERRVQTAVDLFRAGEVDAIMGCGGLGRNPPAEADVIRLLCLAAGVPADRILSEDQSASTAENLSNARALLAPYAPSEIVVVSDHYHLPRARILARRLDLPARFVATPPPDSPWPRRLRMWLREGAALAWTLIRR